MAATTLRCLILGRDPSGESHQLLTFLNPTEGLLRCLLRVQRNTKATQPDLFDEGEISLEPAKDGGTRFAREYRLLTRQLGIARQHRSLERASRLANLVRKNPPPPESSEVCYQIIFETFAAMAQRPRPDAAYFKGLWLMLKDGGWPVHEHWFLRLGNAQKDAAAVLSQPLDAQSVAESTIATLTNDLEQWATQEAHFVLP